MRRTRVKFCGFTRPSDVDAAIAAGIDALGFNVARGPRRIAADHATALVARCPPYVTPVLLTVDADEPTILDLLRITRCTAVQLHGSEPPELAERLRRRVPVTKAFAIASFADLRQARGYPADSYLLDTKVPGADGGTGRAWDWSLLVGLDLGAPIVVAGGLTDENVAAAITAVRPWAVDTASGIEDAPGHKDPSRMAAFLAAVAQADAGRQGEQARR